MMFQESLRVLQGYFKDALKEFNMCLKISRIFKKVSRVLQGRLNIVSTLPLGVKMNMIKIFMENVCLNAPWMESPSVSNVFTS